MLGLVYTTCKGQGCLPLMLGLVYTTCKDQGCLPLILGLVYTTCKGQGCLPLMLGWVYTTCKGQGCLPLMLGLVYTTCKGQGCLPLMLGLVYTNHFSSIAMEAVLHTKQQSNLLLEPTRTAQWGLTFYLKETRGTLVGFKLTATHHYKTDTIQPLRHAAQSFGNLSYHCRVQSTAISNWLHITVLYSTLILFHPYLYQLKQLG